MIQVILLLNLTLVKSHGVLFGSCFQAALESEWHVDQEVMDILPWLCQIIIYKTCGI